MILSALAIRLCGNTHGEKQLLFVLWIEFNLSLTSTGDFR